jgi:predicted Zn finger-like uncharacterized protein
MPLTTRCRRCGRLFPVYAQQIKARGSKVECPQCGSRFNAIAGLLDEQIPPSEIGRGRRRPAAPKPRDFSPPSGMIAVDAERARPRQRLWWGLGVLALTAALIGQATWWERGAWMGRPPVWQALAQVCERLGCSLPLPRLAGSMEILRPALAERPGEPAALQLSLTLLNTAAVAQRLPLLQLELYDKAGRLLAARRLAPARYAPDKATAEGIGPGRTQDVQLDIAALQPPPAGFRVRLF